MATLAFATRLRKSIGPKSRLALGLLALVFVGVVWLALRDRAGGWPVRVAFEPPPKSRPLGFGPDGRTFLTAGPGGIVPYDLGSGRPGKPWETRSAVFVNRGAWSPDGRTYAAMISAHPSPGSFELIEAASGRTKATISTTHPLVFHFAFVDGGRSLRTILGDSAAIKEVATWDVATGKVRSTRSLALPTRGVHYAFAPGGRWLATHASIATSFALWDLETGVPPATLADPSLPGYLAYELAFSPDGQKLAIGRAGGFVDIWDVVAKKVSMSLRVHTPNFVSYRLGFSPDGRTLVSNGLEVDGLGPILRDLVFEYQSRFTGWNLPQRDENLFVDLATGADLGRFSSHHMPFFSRDGRSIATTGVNSDGSAVIQVRDLSEAPARKGNHP